LENLAVVTVEMLIVVGYLPLQTLSDQSLLKKLEAENTIFQTCKFSCSRMDQILIKQSNLGENSIFN